MNPSNLQDAERELTELTADQARLQELNTQYELQLTSAEQAWRSERSTETLDALQRAKSLLITVQTSLQEQRHEIAKAQAYVAELYEQKRKQEILAEIAAGGEELATLQVAHTERLRKLQDDVWQEILSLDSLRAEWKAKQTASWQQIRSLDTDQQAAIRFVEQSGIDLLPLRMAAPAVGSLLPHQTSYTMPTPENQELQAFANELSRLTLIPEATRANVRHQSEDREAVVRRQQSSEANARLLGLDGDK